MAEPIDPRFLGDAHRQAQEDARATMARIVDAEALRERENLSPEERATEVLKYAATRAMMRPSPDAPHAVWASYLSMYPSPASAHHVDGEEGPLSTPAEVSLGQVLNALPDDSPWLVRLEKADEDFGRPLGDCLRLRRWSSVLVDMHFPELAPDARGLVRAERGEMVQRYFEAVWAAYGRFRTSSQIARSA